MPNETTVQIDQFSELGKLSGTMNDFFASSLSDTPLLQFSVIAPWATFSKSYKTRDVMRNGNKLYAIGNYNLPSPTLSSHDKIKVELIIDNTYPNQMDALYGIVLIILVIIVLFGFSASFHSAVDSLVVVPLERMMNTLRKSATVMLKSMKAMEEADENNAEKKLGENLDEELETEMLEKMVDKRKL
jgi:hypothetical protein